MPAAFLIFRASPSLASRLGRYAGAGSFNLGAKALTVGGLNTSTEVSGVIQDGGLTRISHTADGSHKLQADFDGCGTRATEVRGTEGRGLEFMFFRVSVGLLVVPRNGRAAAARVRLGMRGRLQRPQAGWRLGPNHGRPDRPTPSRS